jgi:hypothetical protein
MSRRPRAVRLGIPALFVAILTFVALWRVSAPMAPAEPGASPSAPTLIPLTRIAEVITDNAVGRRASLEHVVVREVPSPRTLWVAAGEDRVFAVLDPDVKNLYSIPVQTGARVTLIGLVRGTPTMEVSTAQWKIDAKTAETVEQLPTYLYVTEIRPAN